MKHFLLFSLLLLGLSASAVDDRNPEYLLEVVGTGEIIYIDAPKQFSYNFNGYMGKPGSLKAITISKVTRFRDGGTTNMQLADGGSIYVPSPFNKDEKAAYTDSKSHTFELIQHPTTPENLAAKLIDASAPLKSKSTIAAKIQAALSAFSDVIKTSTAQEIKTQANALDSSDVEVDQVFRDHEGNVIVRFKYGAKSIGTNMTFWGPHQDGKLYQLQEAGFGGTLEDYKLTFLAPSAANPTRHAQIAVEKKGNLVLSCDDTSLCFTRVSKAEERAMQATLRAKAVGLEGLPSVRRIEYVFKVEGEDTYVVVDAPRFNYSYDFEAYIGPKGNLQPVKVVNVSRFRDGGTTNIRLADGRIIHSPTPFKKDALAKLLASSQDQVGSKLEKLATSIAFVESIGLDTKRFNITELRTPVSGQGACSVFLTVEK